MYVIVQTGGKQFRAEKNETLIVEKLEGEPVHLAEQDEAQAFWIGNVAEGKVDPLHFSARLTGSFTPETSGEHRVGIVEPDPEKKVATSAEASTTVHEQIHETLEEAVTAR